MSAATVLGLSCWSVDLLSITSTLLMKTPERETRSSLRSKKVVKGLQFEPFKRPF